MRVGAGVGVRVGALAALAGGDAEDLAGVVDYVGHDDGAADGGVERAGRWGGKRGRRGV